MARGGDGGRKRIGRGNDEATQSDVQMGKREGESEPEQEETRKRTTTNKDACKMGKQLKIRGCVREGERLKETKCRKQKKKRPVRRREGTHTQSTIQKRRKQEFRKIRGRDQRKYREGQ